MSQTEAVTGLVARSHKVTLLRSISIVAPKSLVHERALGKSGPLSPHDLTEELHAPQGTGSWENISCGKTWGLGIHSYFKGFPLIQSEL